MKPNNTLIGILIVFFLLFLITKNKKATEAASSYNVFELEEVVKKITDNLGVYEAICRNIGNKGELDTTYIANAEERTPEDRIGIKNFKENYTYNIVESKKKSFQLLGLLDKLMKR
ncbi:hypothetical protein FG167_03175 [Lacinutrix sp. WUR7]|uniref:hypothetical protein n=1 Tax=Lacinutrix sp. WUR7 TaxID=2653681 RepID=UPI00193D771A|nr:hypothetical protein [Lacinutrix sp. WUR7]QRM88265.1 hypothetical protein FG167_03175 [Lacinutrix sp. WUR7]